MRKQVISFVVLFCWLASAFRFSPMLEQSPPGRQPSPVTSSDAAPPQLPANTQATAPDGDFDGLADDVEGNGWCNSAGCFQTNPADPDTDHDSLTDGQEQLFDTNPLDDTSPGIYVEYDKDLKTSKYFVWHRHGDKYITDPDSNAVVVRRGATFYVGGPAGATLHIGKSKTSLTDLTFEQQQICGLGRWKITVPTGGTVGRYTIILEKGSWSKSLNLYVIFELPPNMSEEDVEAFLYSDNPDNVRDEYSIFYTTSETKWDLYKPYHKSRGSGYRFQTDQYKPYVFEDHVIDVINGYSDRESAVIALGHHVDETFIFEAMSIRYNMWDALHKANHQAQCSTHSNVLTGFARAAGIPARPVGIDWDEFVVGPILFDYSTEVWVLPNDWKTMRAYKSESESPEHYIGDIYPPILRSAWGSKHYKESLGDMIVAGKSNWNMEHMNTYWDQPRQWDYLIGNYNKHEIVKWDWVDALARPYWGWSQEPADIGDPPYVPPWPANTPTPTLTPTPTITPTSTNTPTPTNTPTSTLTTTQMSGFGVNSGPANTPTPTPTAAQASGFGTGSWPDYTPTPTATAIKEPAFVPASQNTDTARPASVSLTTATIPYLPVILKEAQQVVQLGRVTADYGVDLDGDGRFDQLVIEVEVNATRPGDYTIGGLIDSDKFDNYSRIKGIAQALRSVHLEAGAQTVQLTFDGRTISQAEVDGPYQVTYVWISDLPLDTDPIELQLSRLDSIDPAYTTAAYRVSDFENLGASLSKVYTHQAYDTNKDGYFDTLIVNTDLDITENGVYRVEADLVDASGEVVASASWDGSGSQVSLQFNVLLGDVSSYRLSNVLLYNAKYEIIDSDEAQNLSSPDAHTIGPLYHLGIAALESTQSVTPTVTGAAAIDADQDGDFDSLDFTVNTAIAVEGDYRLEGWLESSNGALVAWKTTDPVHLSPGLQDLTISFAGQTINAFKANGPYKLIALKVLFGGGYTVIDEIDVAYETSAFSFTDFDSALRGDVLFIDGMEGDTSHWNTGETTWELTNAASHSPLYSWTDSPGGNYGSTDTRLTSQSIALTNSAAPVVTFQGCYDINTDGDLGELQAKADGQVGWTTVATYTGTTSGWVSDQVLITPVIGADNVEFRFYLDTTSSGHADGWYVDDVVVTADYDADDDGLTNDVEINETGTDPADADSDHDGMPDGWEVDNGLDPVVDDADGDADNDGLTNGEEYQNGADPSNPDTDGDGLLDGEDPEPTVPLSKVYLPIIRR
jgi:hypothetical protein